MTEERPEFTVTEGALEAIGNLLQTCYIHGIGITFEPEFVGWKVGYMVGMGGGDLATAYSLETAAKAAEKPLHDLARTWQENRRSRE